MTRRSQYARLGLILVFLHGCGASETGVVKPGPAPAPVSAKRLRFVLFVCW